ADAALDMLGQMRGRHRLAAHAAREVADADEGKRFPMHAVVSPFGLTVVSILLIVMPAKAGIQSHRPGSMDSGFRRNDKRRKGERDARRRAGRSGVAGFA